MDLGTVIGVASGILLLTGAIMTKASLGVFLDVASLMVVLGGTIAAALIAFSLKDMMNTVTLVKKIFFNQAIDLNKIIADFTGYAAIIRKEGPQKLEKVPTDDRFTKKALQLIADGASEENILKIMTVEKDSMAQRHKVGQEMLESMGEYFPAFGMIGTMIGLVIMLLNLDDPSAIGPSMSVALITTFYGAVFANLFAIPAAKKLEQRSNSELMEKELVIQGTLSLRLAENPRIMEEKLQGYLHPSARGGGEGAAAPPAKGAKGAKGKKPPAKRPVKK